MCESLRGRTMSLRVLITGAGGYIGSNAAEFFLGQGCEVTGMIRNRVAERFTRSGAAAVRADLCDFAALDKLFDERKFEGVIHIAARASDVGRDEWFRIPNFEAVKHLAQLCMKHDVQRFVYLSTADVYGLHDFHGETEEELRFDRGVTNPYPKYKILSEEWLKANLPPARFACVRPCVVFGNGDTTITPRAIAFLKSSPFVVHFGKWRGGNRWPLAHVTNVCKTLFCALVLPQAGGQGVTVLDSKYTTLSQYYRELAAEYLPGKVIRELTLPKGMILPLARLSSSLSRNRPLFDPTLYALDTITHNLDFCNDRMRKWMDLCGFRETVGPRQTE